MTVSLSSTSEEVECQISKVEQQLFRICVDIFKADPRAATIMMAVTPYGGIPTGAEILVETGAVPQGLPLFPFSFPPPTPCDVPIRMCIIGLNTTENWSEAPEGWESHIVFFDRDRSEQLDSVLGLLGI